MLTIQIYFRMHHFVVKFSKFSSPQAARGNDPLTKIPRTPLAPSRYATGWAGAPQSTTPSVQEAQQLRSAVNCFVSQLAVFRLTDSEHKAMLGDQIYGCSNRRDLLCIINGSAVCEIN